MTIKASQAKPKNIPRDQLPDPVATAADGRVTEIQTQVLTLTAQLQSAQKYVTDTQALIDGLNLELSNIQSSITP